MIPNRRTLTWSTLLLCAAAVGCDGDAEDRRTPGDEPETKAAFVPDEDPAAPAIVLREGSVTDSSLSLKVVGYGIDNLYGVSFRLEADPGVLKLTSFQSDYSLSRAVEAEPGLSFVVATASGDASGRSVDDDVVGTVRFDRLTDGSSPVRFVTSRSDLVDDTGTVRPEVSWIGGELRVE
jgi:hypothetical protein